MAQYTQTYTFSNGTTADGGQVNTEIVALGTSVNNITNAQIDSAAAIATSKTTLNSVTPRMALNVQSKTTNALTTNQVIQRGWSFVVGSGGTDTNVKSITLPVAYDDLNYTVCVIHCGVKQGSDPNTVDDSGSQTNNVSIYMPGTAAQSASAFSVKMVDTDGSTMSANNRFLFQWMTIGTKA